MIKKLIIAHRGYSEIAPENTRLSFKAAKIFGFDGIEIDVHKTKDGKLVVIHDERIDRTSDGIGYIKDLTLKEIREFNFASKFNKNMPRQSILTYEELLIEFGDEFKHINVEVKTDIIHYKNIEELILKTTNKIKPKAEIIYSAFKYESMQIMRKLDKNAILGFLFVDSNDLKDIKDLKKVCNYIHPWFKSLLNKNELKIYEKINLPMNLWSFDSRNIKDDEWVEGSNKAINFCKKIKLVNSLISNSII